MGIAEQFGEHWKKEEDRILNEYNQHKLNRRNHKQKTDERTLEERIISADKEIRVPFQIVRNDITKMAVDAIVNTANPFPGYGAGTDTAVYQGAGPNELLKDRHEIGFIEQGTSAITPGMQ